MSDDEKLKLINVVFLIRSQRQKKTKQSLLDDAYHTSGKTVSLTTKHTGIQDQYCQSSEELMVMRMPCMQSSMMEMMKYTSSTSLLQI